MTLQQLSDILKGFYALQGEAQSITRDDLAKFLVEKGIVKIKKRNNTDIRKRYTVRYMYKGNTVTTTVCDYSELNELIKYGAKNSIIETRPSEGMPLTWHNQIAKHNSKIKQHNYSERPPARPPA